MSLEADFVKRLTLLEREVDDLVKPEITGSALDNALINGAFLWWQRGASFAAAVSNAYWADRFVYTNNTATAVHTISQSADVPTVAQAGVKIPNSALIDCTTIDAAIAATDIVVFGQRVEGYRWLLFAERPLVLDFWAKATKTGIYCASLRNSGSNRSFVSEFTMNTTATWEYKSLPILASPSAGTWDYTTGIGLSLMFCLASGTNFHTTPGIWQTGNLLATANQVNACDSTANDFQITGIRLRPAGATNAPLLPDFQLELAKLSRYAYFLDATNNTADMGNGNKATAAAVDIRIALPNMRIPPSALISNVTGYTAGSPGTTTIGSVDHVREVFFAITGALSLSIPQANRQVATLRLTAATSWDGTIGNNATLRVGPDVILGFNAEL